MFWVGDLRTADTLDEVRVYCHHTYIPGLQAYRKPIFPSAHVSMKDPYTHMAGYIPRRVGTRYETIIDDGVNCTIDWTKTPVSQAKAQSINFVEEFPAGRGRNPQS